MDLVTRKNLMIGAGVAAGTVGVIVLVPYALPVLGFGPAGVKATTLASGYQSVVYGGFIPAGSTFSLFQSTAATGSALLPWTSTFAYASVTGLVPVAVAGSLKAVRATKPYLSDAVKYAGDTSAAVAPKVKDVANLSISAIGSGANALCRHSICAVDGSAKVLSAAKPYLSDAAKYAEDTGKAAWPKVNAAANSSISVIGSSANALKQKLKYN